VSPFLAGFAFAAAVSVVTPPLPPPPPDNRDIEQEALPGMVSRKYLTPTPGPTHTPGPSQTVGPDGRSVDAIVTALYQSVSCGPEVEPNWERMSKLFLPGAKIIPPRTKSDAAITVLDGKAFQERVKKLLESWKQKGESTALYENETARQEQCFGKVCQVFSTFETRHAPGDPKAMYRGIHSIQLVNDGSHWWIVSLAWDGERPDNPIPPQYEAQKPSDTK
jgi:hypothetical protein